MGERGQAACGTDRRDRLDRTKTVAWHIGGATPGEKSPERILDARRVSGGDQRPSHRRATKRVVVGLGDVCELRVDAHIELSEALDRPLETHSALGPLAGECRLEGLVPG